MNRYLRYHGGRKMRHRVWGVSGVAGVYLAASYLVLLVAAFVLVCGAISVLHHNPVHVTVFRRDIHGQQDERTLSVKPDSSTSPAHEMNCTPPSIDNFPPSVLGMNVLKHGGFLINLAAVCYLFGVLALICDGYFMSSLEIICEELNLSEDVAGASFMAVGGSAPELFASVFGLFIAKGNIGVGTVIGSAVFNILCVVGLCGLLAGQIVYLTKWPLWRDFMFYTITVVAFGVVILDNEVHWWESLIFIILYTLYLTFLYFDPSIKRRVESYSVCLTDHGSTDHGSNDHGSNDDLQVGLKHQSQKDETSPIFTGQTLNGISSRNGHADSSAHDDAEVNTLSPFIIPVGFCKRFIWFTVFPATLLFYLTIPNCSLRRWKSWYPVTFLVALAWIGAVTYVLVWMVTVLGYVFSVPDTVMGLTLLAAGSSMPDTVLSVIAARNGYGDMAICHSVGSNIFDILLGLGLPWFLHSTAVYHGKPVPTFSDGLTIIAGLLLLTVLVALVIFKLASFKLNKKIGAVFIVCYLLFLIPAILFEMDVLIKGLVLPGCPRSI